MTYFTRALYVSGPNPQRSVAVSQVFSSYFKRIIIGLRLENEICLTVSLNGNTGSFHFVVQTVDSNNNSIDFDTYGKQSRK